MDRYSDSDIEQALRTVATLIDRYGGAYWPILEKLERELAARRTRAARLAAWLKAPEAALPPDSVARRANQSPSVAITTPVRERIRPVQRRASGARAARAGASPAGD